MKFLIVEISINNHILEIINIYQKVSKYYNSQLMKT